MYRNTFTLNSIKKSSSKKKSKTIIDDEENLIHGKKKAITWEGAGKVPNRSLSLERGALRLVGPPTCLRVMGEPMPMDESRFSPREGLGREGRADSDPPGLGVGLNELIGGSSADGNLSCFIRACIKGFKNISFRLFSGLYFIMIITHFPLFHLIIV